MIKQCKAVCSVISKEEGLLEKRLNGKLDRRMDEQMDERKHVFTKVSEENEIRLTIPK